MGNVTILMGMDIIILWLILEYFKNIFMEVTVKGPISKETGMVMNISDMKVLIDEVVMKKMDHKHLDKDVAEFRDNKIVTTTENVAVFIYESVKNRLPDGLSLYEIKLHETDKNVVIFRGEYA
ncbi:6-pyruvoyl tetrahydrobiopterin synthase [Armadillidium nasatum]|uniref:6-pyruvoyltetrahydropterin synthase n=1 Tax=Armadillidium nasatum TaxID=96803 RepID=A0A5N5SJP9_9CRUS|nr:6-pyruvoyl tetrahydrobiopterin synthase [Armadillidium nasatum]